MKRGHHLLAVAILACSAFAPAAYSQQSDVNSLSARLAVLVPDETRRVLWRPDSKEPGERFPPGLEMPLGLGEDVHNLINRRFVTFLGSNPSARTPSTRRKAAEDAIAAVLGPVRLKEIPYVDNRTRMKIVVDSRTTGYEIEFFVPVIPEVDSFLQSSKSTAKPWVVFDFDGSNLKLIGMVWETRVGSTHVNAPGWTIRLGEDEIARYAQKREVALRDFKAKLAKEYPYEMTMSCTMAGQNMGLVHCFKSDGRVELVGTNHDAVLAWLTLGQIGTGNFRLREAFNVSAILGRDMPTNMRLSVVITDSRTKKVLLNDTVTGAYSKKSWAPSGLKR